MSRNKWAALASAIPVIAALVLGMLALGGPGNQRLMQTDLNTVRAMGAVAQQIRSTWQSSGMALPPTLQQLSPPASPNPLTNKPFVYRAKSGSAYELCAQFPVDNREATVPLERNFWPHPKGDYCFQLNASQPVPQVPFFY